MALIVACGGAAYAAIPDSSGVIHGCAANNNGTLRVIDDSSESCRRQETPLSWNQAGPQGPPGAAGSMLASASIAGPLQISAASDWTTLPGATVTVDVPDGAVVELYATLEASAAHCTGNYTFLLQDASDDPNTAAAPAVMNLPSTMTNGSYQALASGSALPGGAGGTGGSGTGWAIVTPAPGSHTFVLRYQGFGCGPASIRDVRLFANVVRPG